MDVVAQHVNSAWTRKVGGILIGRPHNASVTVQAAIPAEQVEQHGNEIAFLPVVWERTYDVLIDRYPGSRIVGWYHSHPGAGPILSDYDRRLHSVLFSEAPSVALVLDPVAQQSAWYGWVLGRLAPAGAAPRSAFVAGPARRGRAAVAAAIAIGVAAAGAGGYLIGRERAPGSPSTVSAQLRARLRAEEGQARGLGERLAAAQNELAQAAAEKTAREAELAAIRTRLRRALQSAPPRAFVLRLNVQPGDTLWGLAQRVYGDPQGWKRIYRANTKRLPDPDVLRVGQMILVPLP
jgi:proteasome lid subunit RPN8/RPN11